MNPDTARQPGLQHPLRSFVLTFGLILGLFAYVQFQFLPAVRGLDERLSEQNRRLEDIENKLSLLHFSNLPTKSSQEAILAHLKFWSDQLAKYGYNRAMEPGIQAKMDIATQALKALGKPSYAAVEKAFVDALVAGDEQQSHRELLLDIAAELDKDEAADLCYEVLANPGQRSDMRNHAARTLLKLDPDRAGLLLKEIILSEAHTGMVRPQPVYLNQVAKKLPPGIIPRTFLGFFNNIHYLLQSNYPHKEDVLLTVLQQDWHNISTYAAVVEGLRGMKSKRAAELFQRYFDSGPADMQAPTVRSKMAYSIVEILGKDACTWLRNAYTREKNSQVRNNLGSLIRDYCR